MLLCRTLRTLIIAIICGALLSLSFGCANNVEKNAKRQYYDPPINGTDAGSVASQADDETDGGLAGENGGDNESKQTSTAIAEDGNDPAVDESRQEVSIGASAFDPKEITVTAGTIIVWTNEDEENHEVHADDDAYQLGNIGQGAQVQVAFDTAGTFTYHCHVHPTVQGTIIVER